MSLLFLFVKIKLLKYNRERESYLAMLGISKSEALCDSSISIGWKSITASWVQVQLYELWYKT